MKITYRQTRNGMWLVCAALPHVLGVGVKKVGTPTGAYTTGHQFGSYTEEQDARTHMENLASEHGYEIVEWVTPTEFNQDFLDIDLPDEEWISINPDKTIMWYKGKVLKNFDVTPGKRFGYKFELQLVGHDECFLASTDECYQVGELKQAILRCQEYIDEKESGR